MMDVIAIVRTGAHGHHLFVVVCVIASDRRGRGKIDVSDLFLHTANLRRARLWVYAVIWAVDVRFRFRDQI